MGQKYIETATMVGKEIEMGRKNKGMTTKRLAKALGINERIVIDWEKGKILPNDGQIYKIATLLQIPPQNLKVSKNASTVVPYEARTEVKRELRKETPKPVAAPAPVVQNETKEPEKKPFWQQFSEAIKNAGLSDQEVSELTGIPKYTIYDFKTNRSHPSASQIEKLNSGFGIKFDVTPRPEKKINNPSARKIIAVSEFFRENLKLARVAKHMTQNELAVKALSKNAATSAGATLISNMENGHTTPTKEELDALNKFFGVDLNEDPNKAKRRETKLETPKEEPKSVSTSRIDRVFMKNVLSKCKTSEEELCKKCGVVSGYFKREAYEQYPVTLEMAVKVSKCIGVSIEELCRDAEADKLQAELAELEKKAEELRKKLQSYSE